MHMSLSKEEVNASIFIIMISLEMQFYPNNNPHDMALILTPKKKAWHAVDSHWILGASMAHIYSVSFIFVPQFLSYTYYYLWPSHHYACFVCLCLTYSDIAKENRNILEYKLDSF